MACIKLRGECTIACTMVSGLKWGHIIAEYALFLLINYLTNTWGLGFANAAGIINLFFGISKNLEICFAFVADACLGTFKALLLSSLLYSIGLAFLTMSTPPVLSNFAGNCNRYEAECVGPVQKAFFFTSLVLMGVGMAGHAISLDAFLRHHQTPCHDDHLNQQADEEEEEEKEDEFWSVNNLLVILISGVAALALSNIGPWEIKFAVPAIFFFTATLVFFAGKALGFYSNYGDKPKGSALTTLLRVFVAATCKSCRKLPANSDELYQAHDANHKLSHTNGCWWLDKAAIPLPKEESRWKLCNVREVEETKLSVQTAMVWPPIIICGLVSSIGSTFFVVQAGKMSHNLGKWQVPPTILLLLSNAAKYGTTACFKLGVKDELEEGGRRREEMRELGPGSAMLYAVVCCLTAALVENKRRRHINSNNVISIFWLIPQFLFLIIVDTFFQEPMKIFFKDNAAPTMKKYAVHLTQFVWGIGQALSLVSVLACKKWFNNDVDQSRLDKYYWTLTALSAVTLTCYFLAMVLYWEPRKQSANPPPPNNIADQQFSSAAQLI